MVNIARRLLVGFRRLFTHLGLMARAVRGFAAGVDGTGRLEVLRDGAAHAHLAPEKLVAVASRIEQQPLVGPTGELRGRNVARVATFPLRSIN